MKRLCVFLLADLLFFIPALGSGEEAPQYVNIPSRYSDKELVIDGYDNDWKDDQAIPHTDFEWNSISAGFPLIKITAFRARFRL